MRRIFAVLASELRAYLDVLVGSVPGVSGKLLRSAYYRARFAALGRPAHLAAGLVVRGGENIRIGSRFYCGLRCTFLADGGGRITIGDRVALNAGVDLNAGIDGEIDIADHVLIGPNVIFRTTDHSFSRSDVPIWTQGHEAGRIVVEEGVWIGAGAIILRDVRIGKGAVVAAGAVVTSNVAPFSVVGGVPARLLKWRDGHAPTVQAQP